MEKVIKAVSLGSEVTEIPALEPGQVAVTHNIPTEANAGTIAYALLHSFVEVMREFPHADLGENGWELEKQVILALNEHIPDAYMHHLRGGGRHSAFASLEHTCNQEDLYPLHPKGSTVEHWVEPLFVGGPPTKPVLLKVQDPEDKSQWSGM
jgi:hypothetical protein